MLQFGRSEGQKTPRDPTALLCVRSGRRLEFLCAPEHFGRAAAVAALRMWTKMFALSGNSNRGIRHLNLLRSFIVGRDHAGRWVAVEPHGLAGGIFVSRKAALDYAEFETGHRAGAVLLASGPVELAL